MTLRETVDLFQFGTVDGRVSAAPGSDMARAFCDGAYGDFSGDPAGVILDPSTSLSFQLASNAFRVLLDRRPRSGHEGHARCSQ